MRHKGALLIGAAVVSAVLAMPGPGWAQQYHDCVVIVLDASGSMKETMGSSNTIKMAAAKTALKQVLVHVPESTHIGLLAFSSQRLGTNWLFPLGPRDDAALAQAIDRLRPGGGTPLGQFITIGADRLLEEREKQFGYATYRLLVVTDGEATDKSLMERNVPEVLARGITVDVIGVNMKQNHTLATKVHSYRGADDPEALTQALAEILAEVSVSDADATGEEAFEILAPIPIEIGAAMIEALSHRRNQPIGPGSGTAAAPAAAARRPQPAPSPASRGQGSSFGKGAMTVLLVLIAIVVIVSARSKKGRRRR